jgi:hypothetical protein
MTIDGPTTLLSGITGSRAYGMARPDSDTDRHAIFAAPTVEFHGLNPPIGKKATICRHEPDVTLHEAGKAAALLLNGNPTMGELLWLPEDCYETRTPWGDALIGMRKAFLSAPRVRASYLGFASQQFDRLRKAGRFPNVPTSRIAKHARHLIRLVEQGTRLWVTGELQVRVDDPHRYFAFGERVVDDPDFASGQLARAELTFAQAPTVLPDEPDVARVEEWLLAVRGDFYDHELGMTYR